MPTFISSITLRDFILAEIQVFPSIREFSLFPNNAFYDSRQLWLLVVGGAYALGKSLNGHFEMPHHQSWETASLKSLRIQHSGAHPWKQNSKIRMYSSSSVGYFCPQFGTKSKAKHISKDFYPVCLHSYPVMHHSIQLSLCCQKRLYISNTVLTWENKPFLHPLLLIHTTITTPTPPWLLPEKFPFFFIGPESDHWLCLSVTDSLTHSVAFSWLDSREWCQLPVNVVTVILSCDKLF